MVEKQTRHSLLLALLLWSISFLTELPAIKFIYGDYLKAAA
jgi:hypothetical protein